MLEFLRRSATSVFAWVILGVLALVFGLSFGLPSDSLTFGTQPIVKVYGDDITDTEYRYQFNLMSRVVPIPDDPRMQELVGLKEEVLDATVERELLAEKAEALGLETTQWDAESLVLDGHVIVLGDTYNWLGEESFNYDLFTNGFLRGLQVPEPKYLEIQQEELLSRTMRDVMLAGVAVSPSRLREAYEAEANQISLRYVRFPAARYADLVDPSADAIEQYAQTHRDELEEQYESQGMRFSKLPQQAELSLIEIATGDGADREAKAALARIRGGEPFPKVAREVSEHEATARAGGEYGWVNVEGTGSGLDPVVDEALADLEAGETSGVLEGEDSLFIVQVQGRREGDVPEDQAILELAEEALEQERGRELARQAAQEALLAVREGKNLEDLFQAPPALDTEGASPIESITGDDQAEDPSNPRIRETGLFGQGKPIPGLGSAPELSKAVWDAEEDAEVIQQVFEVDDGFVIAGIQRKETATDEGFAEQRDQLSRRLARQKASRIIASWAKRECLEAKAKGDISASEAKIERVVTYDTPAEGGKQAQPGSRSYSVCDRVGKRGGLLRTGLASAQGRGGAD